MYLFCRAEGDAAEGDIDGLGQGAVGLFDDDKARELVPQLAHERLESLVVRHSERVAR